MCRAMGESPEAGHRALVTFGERMRSRRKQLGMTQETLADMCGLHWTYLGQIERGRRNIGLLNIVRIANALRVSAATLLDELSP
jgi:transcriptional regulator with XRE-family HTH domain